MKVLLLLALLLPFTLEASSEKLFIVISYYDGLGEKFRKEKVVSYNSECIEKIHAEVIILDKNNDLREIAMYDENGKWRGHHGKDKAAIAKVNTLFKSATFKESECLKKVEVVSDVQEKSDEELIEEMKSAIRPLPLPPTKNKESMKLE